MAVLIFAHSHTVSLSVLASLPKNKAHLIIVTSDYVISSRFTVSGIILMTLLNLLASVIPLDHGLGAGSYPLSLILIVVCRINRGDYSSDGPEYTLPPEHNEV